MSLESLENFQDDKKLVAYFTSQVKRARNDRIPFEREWYLNLAFYFGKQWVTWSASHTMEYARLIEPRPKPWQVRLTVNKIRTYVIREISRLNQERPRGFVVPATQDISDVAAAKAAEQVYDHLLATTNHDIEQRRADLWAAICGTGFLKVFYDPSKEDPSAPTAPEGFDQEVEPSGSVAVMAVSPFHIFVPDLELENVDDQPWIAHVSTLDPYTVQERYGINLEPDTKSGSSPLDDRFLRSVGIKQNDTKNSITVYEIWTKPCKEFPSGGLVVFAQDRLLQKIEGNPYSHGQYPFTRRVSQMSGRFYGTTFVEDLRPLQVEYNRARSQLIENRNLMGRPKLLAQHGAIDPRRITNAPGEIVLYKPGMQPPTPLPIAPLPQYIAEDIERIRRDMDDIASQHEVSQGKAPSGVEAATAIAYLQEADSLSTSTTTRDKELAYERVGRQMLSLTSQFWDINRLVRIVGDNGVFEAFTFSKSDLVGATDYRVEEGSGTPISRAAKQAQITDLMIRGLIPPQKGLKYMGMGETSRLYEEMQVNIQQAERENLKLFQLTDPQGFPAVNDFDEDIEHVMTHDDYRKRQEWESASPLAQAAMKYHVYLHLMQISMKYNIPVETPPPPTSPQQMMEMQSNPFYVDPFMEQQLRRIYTQIAAGGLQQQPQNGMSR